VLTLEHVRPAEEILRDQSANFRRNVRRARAAADASGLAFRILEGRRAVLPHRELVARLAAESWKGRPEESDRVAIPYEGAQRRFVEALLAAGDSGLEPVLCLGEIAGEPVQVLLSFRHRATLTALLIFRRDIPAAASAGHLALLTLVDWCLQAGVRRLDLNATQDWLRHLSDSRHRLLNVATFRPTPRGRLYDLIARWRRRRPDGPAS
jgi:CelD/BcsL family acetyltransferase involved in cellulose biosynthesis